jgi:hypothetical protein
MIYPSIRRSGEKRQSAGYAGVRMSGRALADAIGLSRIFAAGVQTSGGFEVAVGPGKYDDLCTYVREKTVAAGAIVIVIGGARGSGFSVQGTDPRIAMRLADVLDELAA